MYPRKYQLDHNDLYQDHYIARFRGWIKTTESNRYTLAKHDKTAAIMVSYSTIVAIIYNGRLYHSSEIRYSVTTSKHRGQLLRTCYRLGIRCDPEKQALSTTPLCLQYLYDYIEAKEAYNQGLIRHRPRFPKMYRLAI